MANETVFRDKAIERIQSPDQLNDYVKLSDPGVWFILIGITVILLGACLFGAVGHIDSTVPAVGISENGNMVCLVKKEYSDRLGKDMQAKIDQKTYPATLASDKPLTVDAAADSYLLYVGDLVPGEWVYEVAVDGDFDDGTYEVQIVTESITPLKFLFGNEQ